MNVIEHLETETQRIYRLIPKIACKRKCQESCGVIVAHPAERVVIEFHTGEPFRQNFLELDHLDEDLRCPYLKDGDCEIYTWRPLLCRAFGVVKEMRCPHGCVPVAWMQRKTYDAMVGGIRDLLPGPDITTAILPKGAL